MLIILLTIVGMGLVSAFPAQPNPGVSVISQRQYDECSGKDSSNYTVWTEYTEALTADITQTTNHEHQLIQYGPDGQRVVNSLRSLTIGGFPAGAYTQGEGLYLVTGGPLEGNYVYEKLIYLDSDYLKHFSSVLGYSYIPTKSATLLISDHLDVSVLISPTGAFEAFKRGCNTQCSGRGWKVA